jgi:hypothetical protein
MLKSKYLTLLFAAGSLSVANPAQAVMFSGIDFPQGAISFADSVVSYDPLYGGGPAPTDPNYTNPNQALGVPDYAGPTGSVSLGDGGRIVLEFLDNYLTGSDDNGFDLHIFEIGPDVEDTFVDISMDGNLWYSVGKVTGGISSIDIDSFGFTSSYQFSFVRLTDDTLLDGQTGTTVGADIDAVGAISTVRRVTSVPDSGSTLLLVAASLFATAGLRRKFTR